MVVFRSPTAEQAIEGRVMFGTVPLPVQDYVRILGVDMDRELRFERNLKLVAHQATLRVSVLRRVASS